MRLWVTSTLIAALGLGASSAAAAQEPVRSAGTASAAAPAKGPQRGYLGAGDRPDVALLIGPPPEPGDAAWAEDGAVFKKTRALVDGPRWKRAQADDAYGPDDLLKGFACAVGAELSTGRTPRTAALLEKAVEDAVDASGAAKQVYRRQRPFVPTDEPICIAREDRLKASFSYPSGHASTGWTYALLLSALAPDRAAQIMSRGRAYGESRVVCGVHWKSDVEAGRDAATATFAVLQSNSAFRADLEAARAEVIAARRAAAGDAVACEAAAALDRTPLE